MSDNQPKDDREELDVAAYCKGLRDLKKNYKLYTNEKKYLFSEDGSKLKHDLSVDGEKIVRKPRTRKVGKPGGGDGGNNDDLYNKLKSELTDYIDEKFDDFKQENNQRFDSFQDQLVKMEKRFNDSEQKNDRRFQKFEENNEQRFQKFEENNEKRFREFEENNEKRFREFEEKNDQRFREFQEENNKKHEESRLENRKQIGALEKRINKKIDDRFDEILKAIKDKK
ncbi:hypothetical protein CJJ23_04860 [Mycoplasmopsis agassizii]|uniref:Uncharacterized protein n=1 Tax=Mycoplasmopsis agassizii TaxID=33922 RepID=A0A269TIP5_9BACT|nr:hypothetical protein [Mycoplasmopsis agassizii]PAK20886.1 hypothetical protein CJJ23_04860 [Mycoplasmopsis agassizii]